MEFLLFAAIFSVTIIAFITILVSAVRIQSRQNAAAEVNQQSQFLLQTFQRYIEESVAIDMPANVTQPKLKLKMASSTLDPREVCLGGASVTGECGYGGSDTTIYVKEGKNGASNPLTSQKVKVTNLAFTRLLNPGGHDTVEIVFTVEFQTTNPEHMFSRTLRSSIARVGPVLSIGSAYPELGNQYVLGTSTKHWHSINDVIFFDSSANYVGIRTPNPTQRLEVNGGLLLRPVASEPLSCSSDARGTLWFQDGGGTGIDQLMACLKRADGNYEWLPVYP